MTLGRLTLSTAVAIAGLVVTAYFALDREIEVGDVGFSSMNKGGAHEWAIYLTNNGPQAMEDIRIEIDGLDDAGALIGRHKVSLALLAAGSRDGVRFAMREDAENVRACLTFAGAFPFQYDYRALAGSAHPYLSKVRVRAQGSTWFSRGACDQAGE